MKLSKQRYAKPSLGRHESQCKICQHSEKENIEQQWLDWGNTSRLAKEYDLSRDTFYRHAHALGLFQKRQRNVKKALERLIEKSEDVEVTAAALVGAVQAYAKINAEGKWIDRVEGVSLNELFERMNTAELEAYAKDGILPTWFTNTVGQTALNSEEEENLA